MTVAINPAYLEIRLSGGASNSDPAASLGGVMSSTRILHQSATGIANITGITIQDGLGNPIGNGTLTYTATGETLKWAAAGQSAGAEVPLTEDGRYAIASSTGPQLFVEIVYANLPGTDQTDTITIANLVNSVWDNISKAESFAGDTEYRCVYLINSHPSESLVGVKEWIQVQPIGADSLAIGLDQAGIGNGSTTGVATTVANESSAPAGVTFSAPSGSGTALSVGTLGPGEAHAVWERRTVPADTSVATSADTSEIRIEVRI